MPHSLTLHCEHIFTTMHHSRDAPGGIRTHMYMHLQCTCTYRYMYSCTCMHMNMYMYMYMFMCMHDMETKLLFYERCTPKALSFLELSDPLLSRIFLRLDRHYLTFTWLHFSCSSRHVVNCFIMWYSLPHWVGLVQEGRESQTVGTGGHCRKGGRGGREGGRAK